MRSIAWPGALAVGVCGLILSFWPVLGVPVSATGVAAAMRAFRRKPDDNGVITVLAFNVFGLSVAVAALIWSLKIGLYGIAVSPWPN